MLKDFSPINGIIAKAHIYPEQIKTTLDGIGVGITAGALMEILPAISAVLTIVWLVIRIYDSVLNIKAKHKEDESRRED